MNQKHCKQIPVNENKTSLLAPCSTMYVQIEMKDFGFIVSKQRKGTGPLLPMRILERVQPYLTPPWDIFPPSYVVSKLSYSHRALVSKWGH